MVEVGIIGGGLIGGSILKTGISNWSETVVTIFDADISVAPKAERINGIWKTIPSMVATADVIFVCVPSNQYENVLQNISDALPKRTKETKLILTDVTSPKAQITKLFNRFTALRSDCEIIMGHPMAGTEHHGFDASFDGLFKDRTWVLFNEHHATVSAFMTVMQLILDLQAHVSVLDAIEHDRIISHISHMPYVLAAAEAIMVARSANPKLAYRLAAGSFSDVTRVAGSPSSISVPMLHENQQLAEDNIRTIEGIVDEFKQATQRNSQEEIQGLFREAQQGRSSFNHVKQTNDIEAFSTGSENLIPLCYNISKTGGVIYSIDRHDDRWVLHCEIIES